MANALKYTWTPSEAVENLFHKVFGGESSENLQKVLDAIEPDPNVNFWMQHFYVDGSEYAIDVADKDKNPAWTVRQRDIRVVPMADATAPLADPMQLDSEGFTEHTGSIYAYSKGLFNTSMAKLALESKLMQMSPADRNAAIGFQKGIADLVKAHNQTLSHMAAMTLSYGGAYNNDASRGFSGVHTMQGAYIPATNFKKAGAKVWTDADCNIPEQMRKIELDFKEANNVDAGTPFEWDIPYDMVVNVLLKNKYFVDEVNKYIALNAPVIVIKDGEPTTSVGTITWQQLVSYTSSDQSKISPIRIVREQQTVQGITTYSTVRGWKPNTAVLRPVGYAGVVVHAKPIEIELIESGEINNTILVSYAKYNNLFYVINKVTPNGLIKSYHTEARGRYATVLDESQYHVCVDTATAD